MDVEEQSTARNEGNENRIKTEDIILGRLQNEPEIKKQTPLAFQLGLTAFILALGVVLYFVFQKPDKFAPKTASTDNPHAAQADSSELFSKRLRLQPMMDSLETIVKANPDDHHTLLSLANVYYDAEMWDKAEPLYTKYLAKEPQDVDARVDYAFVIAQTTGDFKRAIAEIEKGLKYEPDHVYALFNAGILSLRQTTGDKHTSIAAAKEYFLRAKQSALVKDPKMAEQIDQILEEIRKVEEEPHTNK